MQNPQYIFHVHQRSYLSYHYLIITFIMKTHSTYPTSNPRTSLLPKTPFSELVPYVRFYPTGILLGGFFSLKQNPLYVAAVVVGDLGLPRRPCLLFCWHLFWQLIVLPKKISRLLSFLQPVVPLGRHLVVESVLSLLCFLLLFIS